MLKTIFSRSIWMIFQHDRTDVTIIGDSAHDSNIQTSPENNLQKQSLAHCSLKNKQFNDTSHRFTWVMMGHSHTSLNITKKVVKQPPHISHCISATTTSFRLRNVASNDAAVSSGGTTGAVCESRNFRS